MLQKRIKCYSFFTGAYLENKTSCWQEMPCKIKTDILNYLVCYGKIDVLQLCIYTCPYLKFIVTELFRE